MIFAPSLNLRVILFFQLFMEAWIAYERKAGSEKVKKHSIFAKLNPWGTGFAGAAFLIGLYFLILSVANSPGYAISQFRSLWYWFIPLMIGFGVQLGLYTYIKRFEFDQLHGIGASVAASSGVSAGAMIACCLHHIADLLPLLGLSAAALFLIEYQIPFLILGITSNVVGIAMMLAVMQEHSLYYETGQFAMLFRINMKVVRGLAVTLGAGITIMSFILIMNKGYF